MTDDKGRMDEALDADLELSAEAADAVKGGAQTIGSRVATDQFSKVAKPTPTAPGAAPPTDRTASTRPLGGLRPGGGMTGT